MTTADSEDTVPIADKVRFWEEQDKINQELIPRVIRQHELITSHIAFLTVAGEQSIHPGHVSQPSALVGHPPAALHILRDQRAVAVRYDACQHVPGSALD